MLGIFQGHPGCDGGGTGDTSYPSPPPAGLFGQYGLPAYPYSVAAAERPLTSVAHELVHGLGLQHAGKVCTGVGTDQEGSPWPDPGMGYLDGIGLDIPQGGVPGSPTAAYRVIATSDSSNVPSSRSTTSCRIASRV